MASAFVALGLFILWDLEPYSMCQDGSLPETRLGVGSPLGNTLKTELRIIISKEI